MMRNIKTTMIRPKLEHAEVMWKGDWIFEGHKNKLQKGIRLNDTKKYSFPQRNIDTWNGLKEVVIMAKNVHQLKEKLDQYRYGDRTTRLHLRPCIQQLTRYNSYCYH